MAAQGDWPTIADRVSRALGTYASLKRRPSTGFLALLGGIEASTFQLPEKMNEINDLFSRLARSMDILVSDITTVFAGQAMFDEFHLRESAEVRRMFACRIARLTNLFFCDHRLRHFSLEQLAELERLYPFITGGKYPTYVNLELYKHRLEKAVNIARHHYDAEEQVHENPWDVPAQDSGTQAREEEHRIAEAMSEIVIPDEVMQLEIESLVHLGGGRYATEEEARALRPTKVGAELLAKQSKGEMLKEIAGYRPYDPSVEQREAAAASAAAAKRARTEQQPQSESLARGSAGSDASWEFGWSMEDDYAVAECSGIEDYEEAMNPRRDVPLVLLTQNMLPRCKDRYTEHHNKTFLTGLIRGNFEDKPSPRWCRNVDLRIRDRDGIWVPIKEILRVFNEACPNAGQWGVGALIRLAKHDKRGRLQFRGPGPEHDPRAETVSLPCYPLEVAAVQGHSQNIQDLSGWSLRSSMRRSLFLGCVSRTTRNSRRWKTPPLGECRSWRGKIAPGTSTTARPRTLQFPS